MKKTLLFIAFCFVAFLMSSCSNDDIVINVNDSVNEVNVSVSLSNFYSSYNYNDTRHDIKVTEDFRTFNSEHNRYIQTRTLIYDSNGLLVDSLIEYSINTNAVTKVLKLSGGKYTAVSTLTFALKSDKDNSFSSWWDLVDKERLSTAQLNLRNSFSIWCIMSYDSKEFTVTPGSTTSLSMNPSPVGALAYLYLQNFWCDKDSNYPNMVDNGIRGLCVYSQNKAQSYKLDPNAADKYSYFNDLGKDTWYYLSDYLEPTDFDDNWTYFQSNLYDYFFILAPNPHIVFGYYLDGSEGFTPYGESTYTITPGQTYLAYWDYFKVGNPYFGIADNNHWNTYSSSSRANARMQ